MFRVKICGIQTIVDAQVACEAGADAIGLNFYCHSARYVPPDTAATVSAALPKTVHRVGVFVNESSQFIHEVFQSAGLTAVQLHGDEPASFLGELSPSIPVIRAFRLHDGDLTPAVKYVHECGQRYRLPAGVLMDAFSERSFGGTGRKVDWRRLADQLDLLPGLPLILAGGLTHENVSAAVRVVRPFGVDTASGVESSPGVKDHQRIRQFVKEAHEALDRAST